jgi:hypothetical protein
MTKHWVSIAAFFDDEHAPEEPIALRDEVLAEVIDDDVIQVGVRNVVYLRDAVPYTHFRMMDGGDMFS